MSNVVPCLAFPCRPLPSLSLPRPALPCPALPRRDETGTLQTPPVYASVLTCSARTAWVMTRPTSSRQARIATWEAAAKKLDAAKAAFRYDGTAPDVRRKAAAKIEELQNEPILRYTGPKVPIWRRTMDRLDVHEVMKEVKERREETHRDAAEKSRRQSVAAGKLTASDRMRAAEKHAADRHASTSSSSPADSSQEQTQYRTCCARARISCLLLFVARPRERKRPAACTWFSVSVGFCGSVFLRAFLCVWNTFCTLRLQPRRQTARARTAAAV